ncbi:MAG: radical SAM protein [Sandaracinaceae bacterium]|nr:radical SAM protein [Sandaracinaceae bacterium]
MTRTAALIGCTGRLGPAVARALAARGWQVHGLSRRAPGDATWLSSFTRADRRDAGALVALAGGAELVIDLLGFDGADAARLLEATARAGGRPRHLIFASSSAELRPDDHYGRGKLAARLAYEGGFDGAFHALVLPRLVAAVDPARREQFYLQSAIGGRVLHAGDGQARQTIAPVEGVAAVIAALAAEPSLVPRGALNVGPPEPVRVRDAIAALVEGAGLSAPLARHPDPQWRGPHGGGDELLDTTRLQIYLPALIWPDVLEAHRALGAWLAATAPGKRPLPLVSIAHREGERKRVVDVHTERAAVEAPYEPLARVASWLSPGFYLDTGRPCNSACMYCAVPPHADTHGFTSLAHAVEQIEAGAAAGATRAIFVGGEPTIWPELPRALARLREVGLRGHVVMTNGLRLSDPQFVRTLVDGGVATFHLSIDTADEAVSERLSRSRGQLARQQAALDNILAIHESSLYVYVALTRLNAAGLGALLDDVGARASIAGRAPPPVIVAFVKPIGDALVHARELSIPPEERAGIARAAIEIADRVRVPLGIRNLPTCLAPELVPRLADYYLEDYSIDVRTKAREPYSHGEYLERTAACERCAHRALCPGVYREDAARSGTAPYHPLDARGLRRG